MKTNTILFHCFAKRIFVLMTLVLGLCLAREAHAQNQNLTVKITKTDGTTKTVTKMASLQADLTGCLMLSKHLANAQNSIDLSGLACGVYLVRVSNGSDAKMQKIVVK